MIPLPESVIDGALKAHRNSHRSKSEPENAFHTGNHGPIPHQNHQHQHHAKSYQLQQPRGRSKDSVPEQKEDADSLMDQVVDSMIATEQNKHKMVGGMDTAQQLEADIMATERAYNLHLKVLLNDLIVPIFRYFGTLDAMIRKEMLRFSLESFVRF